jgi:hypothetical protein
MCATEVLPAEFTLGHEAGLLHRSSFQGATQNLNKSNTIRVSNG